MVLFSYIPEYLHNSQLYRELDENRDENYEDRDLDFPFS